jgi:hypothetical protein
MMTVKVAGLNEDEKRIPMDLGRILLPRRGCMDRIVS